MAFTQQWCGINVIQYYATDIFRDAGYTVAAALQNIVIIGTVNVFATVLAMYSVNRIGRRTLMWLGFAGLTLMHALIGISYFADVTGKPILVLTLAAIAFYAYTLRQSLGSCSPNLPQMNPWRRDVDLRILPVDRLFHPYVQLPAPEGLAGPRLGLLDLRAHLPRWNGLRPSSSAGNEGQDVGTNRARTLITEASRDCS